MKWSDWLKEHSRTATMHSGETFEAEGFSSDPLVVSDGLVAMAPGRAAVLIGDAVYFITVE